MAKRVTKKVAKKVAAKKPLPFLEPERAKPKPLALDPDSFMGNPRPKQEVDDPKWSGPHWPLIGALVFCVLVWYAVLRYFGIL